jgi:hypothetical protein
MFKGDDTQEPAVFQDRDRAHIFLIHPLHETPNIVLRICR